MKFNEGEVVWTVSKVKVEEKKNVEGTIIWAMADSYFVLDKYGYIHNVLVNEIWKE